MMAPPRTGKILYRPVLVVTCPATIEVTVTPSIIGVSISPLTVGEAPWTVCWYSGRNVSAPNMARPVRKVSAMVTEKFRFLNTCSGRIGATCLLYLQQVDDPDKLRAIVLETATDLTS
jgi:hypothetical protein